MSFTDTDYEFGNKTDFSLQQIAEQYTALSTKYYIKLQWLYKFAVANVSLYLDAAGENKVDESLYTLVEDKFYTKKEEKENGLKAPVYCQIIINDESLLNVDLWMSGYMVAGYTTGNDGLALKEVSDDHESRISDNESTLSDHETRISDNETDIASLQTDKLDITAPTVNAEVGTMKFNDTESTATELGDGAIKYNEDDERLEFSKNGEFYPIGSGTGSASNAGYNFENPDMEINIDGYNRYANATPGDEPETGNGGTPVAITRSIEDSASLVGKQSLKISKSAANGLGEGIGYGSSAGLFSLDTAMGLREAQIKFNYLTTADYADGDMGVFIYDIDNTILLKPSVVDIPASDGEPTEFFATWLPTGGRNFRLIFHVRTTNALAWDMVVDNIRIGAKQDIVGDGHISYDTGWIDLPSVSSATLITHNLDAELESLNVELFGTNGTYSGRIINYQVTGTANRFLDVSGNNENSLYLARLDSGAGFMSPSGVILEATQCRLVLTKIVKNIKLATELTECYANSGDTINTDYDESYTVKGKMGTPLLANTAFTTYDVEIPTLQPDDIVSVEVRSNLDGSWISIDDASVESYHVPRLRWDIFYTTSFIMRGIVVSKVGSRTYRIVFPNQIQGLSDWVAAPTSVLVTWAQVIAASDGYDRWRLRVTKSGNPSEIPPLVYILAYGDSGTSSGDTVIYETVEEDTHDCYDNTTGVTTIKYAGLYNFTGEIAAGTNSYDTRRLGLYVNGVLKNKVTCYRADCIYQCTGTIRCNVGDTVDFRMLSYSTSANSGVRFTATRIGS